MSIIERQRELFLNALPDNYWNTWMESILIKAKTTMTWKTTNTHDNQTSAVVPHALCFRNQSRCTYKQPSSRTLYAAKVHILIPASVKKSSNKGLVIAIRRGRYLIATNDFVTNNSRCACYTTSTPHSLRSAPPYARISPSAMSIISKTCYNYA